MHIRPIRTIEDVTANTEQVTDRRCIIRIGPDADSVAHMGKLLAPNTAPVRSGLNSWFYGTDSYDDAVKLLRYGWPDGTALVKTLTARINARMPKAQKTVVRYRPSVAPIGGVQINFHDIATGGPQPFIGRFQTQERQVGRRIVKIVVDNWVVSTTTTETINARGACVMALIRILETLKFSVDLTIAYDFAADGYYSLALWNVKPAGYPMNADQMAFALIHPSSFRRIGFRIADATPASMPKFDPHYGHASCVKGIAKDWPKIAANYDIIAGTRMDDQHLRADWNNIDTQVSWIKDQLAKQGIHTA